MTDRAILVTGGAGFVGAHACKALRRAGWAPVVFDNLVHGHRDAVRWGPLEVGDLLSPTRLKEVFDQYRPQAVMHFAGFTSVAESVEEPERYWRNNHEGSVALLDAMVEFGVGKIVFSSTAAVYGNPSKIPISEDSPTKPINPYGETKLATEQILAERAVSNGINATALRYFNAAGADPEGEIGELHDPETHLIPLALAAAVGKGPPLRLFGDDYPTPDGTCVRDYIHVSDLAEAHIQALSAGPGFTALNLGTGRGTSVRVVLDTIESVTGYAVPHEITARREGDPAELVADPSRAQRLLGWRAERSDIANIVATAWQWFVRHSQDRLFAV